MTPSPYADDISPLARANAAAAAVMERQAFAIDEAKDDDDLGDGDTGEVGGEVDDNMMDEVDAFLEAHGK
jgi:broad specificity phosphatase PhoE